MDLQTAFDHGFEAVKTYVDAEIGALAGRIAALESRAPVAGPPGERGEAGQRGEPGNDGHDGAPGRDGRDGLVGLQGEKGIDGKDGSNGKDGRDAFRLEDINLALDADKRTLVLAFTAEGATIERRITVPWQLHRGVWKAGAYGEGDAVTWGGSSFIATRDTGDKPETSDAWRLQTKRGRDGKDGKSPNDAIRHGVATTSGQTHGA